MDEALVEHCVASRLLDERTSGDQHDRAVTRSRHVFTDPAGAGWLVEVVRAMETLMYAQDCRDFVGAGKEKRQRTRTLAGLQYHAWLRARHPGDANLADDQLVAQDYYQAEREVFDFDNDKVQRLRKRFTLLYDFLGPALFLDPTFTTSNCTRVSGPFLAVIKQFDRSISDDDLLADHRRERAELSRRTLESLVEHMVPGYELTDHLDHFFARCPAKCM